MRLEFDLPRLVAALPPLLLGMAMTVAGFRQSASTGTGVRPMAAKLFRFIGPLAMLAALWAVQQGLSSRPRTAEAFADHLRAAQRLPHAVDELTTLEQIEGKRERVTFIMRVKGLPAQAQGIDTWRAALRSRLRDQVCASEAHRQVMRHGVEMEYLYTIEGAPSFTVRVVALDCAGPGPA